MARDIALDENENVIFRFRNILTGYGSGLVIETDGDGISLTELSFPLVLSGFDLTCSTSGGVLTIDASASCVIDAGSTCSITSVGNMTITSGATCSVVASSITLNTTGTGNVDIGNATGTIKTYSEQVNYMSTGAKYSQTVWTQSGYKAIKERDRYWYGTTSAVGPTILSGSFIPSGDGTVRIVTDVVGTDATGANHYSGTVRATYKRAGGVLTLTGSTTTDEHKGGGTGTAAAHTAVSGEIRLSITGIAATNMRWEAYSTVYYGGEF